MILSNQMPIVLVLDLLAQHIEILNSDWIIIGRQVKTSAGKYIDLLCMDHDGDLVVVELKKDLTPREVTAQVIDYASCVSDMKLEELAELYLEFTNNTYTLNQAYEKKYGTKLDSDSVNQNVEMVVVASKMDASTERIIRYLRNKYVVDINILFFNVFGYEEKRFISRVWFEEDVETQMPCNISNNTWNHEYYVSFGEGERRWNDACKYGFISGGGGPWYSNTLKMLSVGDRVWANIPQTGYVGVGIVTEEFQLAKNALFDTNGKKLGFKDITTEGNYLYSIDDEEKAEYNVKIKWTKTTTEKQAVKEIGFFGNQNTVCRPREKKWKFTVERLKTLWNIKD
ncbi:uncharacterized protein DUF91 [Hydrogenoanaerobacterium saccharovorans]|uniref:Endonuclease NucS C-terminal domain-containing protein n=1 Tax=Hydrogenoanaerobacterium saccharovorans TaxID=474960 RepID=A0A1H8BMJ0_9FIRM|nr:endonuclease NucS domain-containing protein [Hydrogenoanaerobacterium saccharovorans]RPF47359.1 uncharacterized protein DUF91 [Hydrogenoanaerobacterium saccharovorans]SEM83354.1 Protein of unknown function DUF91 [Hydrogenoanaerobacterium saccharovorans]